MDIQPVYSVQDVVLGLATRKPPIQDLQERWVRSAQEADIEGWAGREGEAVYRMDGYPIYGHGTGRTGSPACPKETAGCCAQGVGSSQASASQPGEGGQGEGQQGENQEKKARLVDKYWEEEVLPGKLTAGVLECFLQDY